MTLPRPPHRTPCRRLFRRLLSAILLSAALAAGLAGLPAEAPAAGPLDGLFGSRSVRSENLTLFPKWQGALERYSAERELPADCAPGRFSRCDLADWQAFLEGQEGRGAVEQLDAVNRQMNEHRYVVDPRNWGVEDYWATPLQFIERDGDCEDYAIAKFMSLRALGWPSERLRIVVVDDLNLRVQHAVLVASVDGTAYVLDNQSPSVMPAARIRHYRPVYSVNEDAWWLYRT